MDCNPPVSSVHGILQARILKWVAIPFSSGTRVVRTLHYDPSILGVITHPQHDHPDDVITHPEPDILDCEVKWALGSITTNKASEDDEIPVELFQILKDDAVKVLHSICQQIWKTQQWPQD